MNFQSSIPNSSSQMAGDRAAIQFSNIDPGVISRWVDEDADRCASAFMESVSSTLDELEIALAAGEEYKLAELGSRLKTSSQMAHALGMTALCQSLACVKMRAPVSQVCAAA